MTDFDLYDEDDFEDEFAEDDRMSLREILLEILSNTRILIKKEKRIMADLTSLTAQVDTNTSVEESAVQLLTNIGAELKAAGTDPAALAALQTKLSGSATDLAAAITANTPAA